MGAGDNSRTRREEARLSFRFVRPRGWTRRGWTSGEIWSDREKEEKEGRGEVEGVRARSGTRLVASIRLVGEASDEAFR